RLHAIRPAPVRDRIERAHRAAVRRAHRSDEAGGLHRGRRAGGAVRRAAVLEAVGRRSDRRAGARAGRDRRGDHRRRQPARRPRQRRRHDRRRRDHGGDPDRLLAAGAAELGAADRHRRDHRVCGRPRPLAPGGAGTAVSRTPYPRIATLKTAAAFRQHLDRSGIPLAFDDQLAAPEASPFARPIEVDGSRVGNRFCILPMEGWDGTSDGAPSELTRRRWRNFGISGAKLIWGGEAVAVRHDGRANPNQLVLNARTQPAIAAMREELTAAHRARFGAAADGDLLIGLQLTHSGRYARPEAYDRPAPLAATHHPVLDPRFPNGVPVIADAELSTLEDDFVAAARLAREAGFAFVDIKACHGYLGHELLAARGRPGRYGGSLENRTRFMRTVIERIRAEVPGLRVAVRLSVFDMTPYRKRPDGIGEPEPVGGHLGSVEGAVLPGFGVLADDDRLGEALDDSRFVLRMLEGLGVRWICATAGSPYYNPHIQRPAMFPPLDGYEPPEDPLRGVA